MGGRSNAPADSDEKLGKYTILVPLFRSLSLDADPRNTNPSSARNVQ